MYKKQKMKQEPKTFYLKKVPNDITKELADTMTELKDKYDLDTEEVKATVNKSYFKSLIKRCFKG